MDLINTTSPETQNWDIIRDKACCTFKISEKGRYIIFIILIVINIVQIAFGLVLFIIGINGRQIGSKLETLSEIQLERIFGSFILFGFVVMVIYLSGIKAYINCAYPAIHYNTGYVLTIWLLVGSINSILGIFLGALSPNVKKNLIQQLRNSLLRGMSQYLSDPSWKQTFDHLQSELECCGTLSYTDWFSTSWINIDFLRHDSRTVQHYTAVDGRVLPPVIPWSCCNPNVPYPCFHDTLQQERSDKIWQDSIKSTVDSIYTVGCLEILKPTIQTGLDATTGITIVIFLLQLIIIIIARYLFTASYNSIILGDPFGYSYGWLYRRRNFGGFNKTEEQMDLMAEQKTQLELKKENVKEKEGILNKEYRDNKEDPSSLLYLNGKKPDFDKVTKIDGKNDYEHHKPKKFDQKSVYIKKVLQNRKTKTHNKTT